MKTIQNLAEKVVRKGLKKAEFLAADLLFSTGFWQAERLLKSQKGQRILCFHGIDERGEKALNGRFLSAKKFEEQVRFLNQNAQIVSLDDFFESRFDAEKFTVAITFDDGLLNNLLRAAPILEKHQSPAAFFPTSAFEDQKKWLWPDFLDCATRLGPPEIEIDGFLFRKKMHRKTLFYEDEKEQKLATRARFSPAIFLEKMEAAFLKNGAWKEAAALTEYWQLMCFNDIRDLAKMPFSTIGAHGRTHADLTFLPKKQTESELFHSKKAIERVIEKPIKAIAWPFGSYDRALLDIAERVGFEQQLAVDFLLSEDKNDPRLRERLVSNPFISNENQMRAIRDGHY